VNRHCIAFAAVAAIAVGCGPEVRPQQFDPMGGVKVDAQDKIKEALKKAGITKEIAAVSEMDNDWLVTLRNEKKAESDEGTRQVPERATVNKTTLEVKLMNPGGNKPTGTAPPK
jgi:hypothetical protein